MFRVLIEKITEEDVPGSIGDQMRLENQYEYVLPKRTEKKQVASKMFEQFVEGLDIKAVIRVVNTENNIVRIVPKDTSKEASLDRRNDC